MAHLVGALGVGGGGRSLDLVMESWELCLIRKSQLAACTEDDRCSDLCPEFFGS